VSFFRGKLTYVLCGALAALIAPARVWAQTDFASISGTVTDPGGAVVPAAEVRAVNEETNATFTTQTNQSGNYVFPQLSPGPYRVVAVSSGFKQTVRSGLELRVGDRVRIDLTLELGAVTEEVNVVSQAPLLESESSSVGQVVEERTVLDLPLNGRNYLQLAKLSAGVLEPKPGDRAAEGGSFVANGVRAQLNNFVLDGIDNNSKIVDIQNSSNVVVRPSVDAVQEFKVETHNFSAEYGYSAGAVVNVVTKSGSNEFHGTLFEFLRNDELDARNFFADPDEEQPKLRRNQFGGSVGGPIVPNKTFFFFVFEGTRQRRGLTETRTLPTPAMKTGDFSEVEPIFDPATLAETPDGDFIRQPFPGNQIPQSRFDPVISRVNELIPNPTRPGLANNFLVNPTEADDRDQFTVRGDHAFGSDDRLFGRFSRFTSDRANSPVLPEPLVGSSFFQDELKEQTGYAAGAGYTHFFNPTTINELRIGYNRIESDLLPIVQENLFEEFGFEGIPSQPGVTGLPQLNVTGFSNFGSSAFIPNFKISETAQVKDSLTLVRGNHTIKAGGSFRWVRSFFAVSGTARGSFAFDGTFTEDPQNRGETGSSFGDFLLGVPSNSVLSTFFDGDLRFRYWGAFVQDDWKVSPRITLNLGLRWELWEPFFERNDLQANFLLGERKLIFPENNRPEGIAPELITDIPDGIDDRGLLETDTNNFAPRVGLAYRLNNKTVIRSGFGMFYADVPAVGASGRLVASPPFRINASFPTDQITPVLRVREGFPPGTLSVSEADPENTDFRAWDPEFPQAYALHWNFNIQREVNTWLFDIGYTGTTGTQLPR